MAPAPRATESGPVIAGHAVSGVLYCEVTVGPAVARPTGVGGTRAPAIACVPARGGGAGRDVIDAADHQMSATDTILERFDDIGFAYGTPTWSLLAGTGTVTVPIALVNHISKPLGTADGTHAASNGTRVFIMSGPTVLLSGGLGLLPTVTVNNSTGTSTFTSAGQKYFQYAGIIKPDSASAAVNWTFGIVDVSKFNFQVGVDAITP